MGQPQDDLHLCRTDEVVRVYLRSHLFQSRNIDKPVLANSRLKIPALYGRPFLTERIQEGQRASFLLLPPSLVQHCFVGDDVLTSSPPFTFSVNTGSPVPRQHPRQAHATYTASPEDLLPSLAQHGSCRHLLHHHQLSFQDTQSVWV